ncbi:MAG: terminase gpA endonuclease subunit [Rubripirellula sp.]
MPSPSVLQHEFASALRASQSHPPRSFRHWIEQEIIIPDGPYVGEAFRIERQPVHGLWIDQVDDPEWQDLVFTAVTQFGKSLLAHVFPILYHACELGQSVTWGLPNADMANTKWQQDFRPVLEASPSLRKLMPRSGSGSRNGSVKDDLMLANGSILHVQSVGESDSGKGGFTSPIGAVTEANAFSRSGGKSKEGDPLRQVRARARAYKRRLRRLYVEGTLTEDDALPWLLREDSTQSEIVSPCPHGCGFIAPDWDQLVGWQDARSEIQAASLSHWICPMCEKKITEKQRLKSLLDAVLLHRGQKIDKRGKVTGPAPETTRLWYHAKPWANLLLEPGDIGAEEWSCEQIPEDTEERISAEKERAQFRWARTYRPPAIDGELRIDRTGVAARAIELAHGILPNDVGLVSVGYDLGDKVGWFAVMCSRGDGSLHVPVYGKFDIHSDRARPDIAILSALKEQLTFLRAGIAKAGGGSLRPHFVGIDVGHEQTAGWNFAKSHDVNPTQSLDQWVMPMRGRGETQMESRKYVCPKNTGTMIRMIDPDRLWYIEWVKKANAFEMHWDSDKFKFRVQQGLCLPVGSPGAISLHAGTKNVHSKLARHVTNERLIFEHVPGQKPRGRWHRFGNNHWFDCLAEAYVGLCRMGYQPPALPKQMDDLDEQLANQQTPAPQPTDEPAAPSPNRTKINSWFQDQA